MTNPNSTTSPAVTKNISYPTYISNAAEYRVAEDTDDYTASPSDIEAHTREIKRIEMWSLEFATVGQIERLYKLASLLLENPQDRTAAQSK